MKKWIAKNYLLAFLIVLTFLKGAVWAAAVPFFQAPDEQYHYATVQYYALSKDNPQLPKDFPIKKTNIKDISTQNLSPELRSFLEKTDFDQVRWKTGNRMIFAENSSYGPGERELLEANLPRFIQSFPPWYVHYGPAYYKAASVIENTFGNESIMTRAFLIRLFSAFLGTILVVCAYFIFRELFLDRIESTILTAIVSFQPELSFVNSSINVDPLLFLAFALFILGSVRILCNKTDKWSFLFILVGILVGTHTKPPGYFMLVSIPIVALFFVLLYQKEKIAFFWKKSKTLTVLIPAVVAFLAIFFALKNFFGNITTTIRNIPEYFLYELGYGPIFEKTVFYWGSFGWLDTRLSRPFVFSIWAVTVLAVAGIARHLVGQWIHRRRKKTENEKVFFFQFLFFIFFSVGVSLMIHFVNLRYADPHKVGDQSDSIGLQGRYFFPAIIPAMALLAFGLAFLLPRINRKWIFWALLAAMIFLNFWSLFDLVIPRYYL